jgi:hypothetical protein
MAAAPVRFAQQAVKFKDRFTALASPGYSRHGGAVTEEFQRELQDDGGLKIFTEMAVHPIVSAVLFAIRMSLRRVRWWVPPVDDTPDAKRKAEFVEECMEDMSQSWNEVMAQAFGMLKYGYVPSELIYKKRLGMTPPKYTPDPGRSRYDDGLIAWRRWQFINPLSLMSGNQWIFDENGRIQGINQLAPPDYIKQPIPIEKLLLFRTDVEWDNPEGVSLLRPMYTPWYYATNLEEIEAIGAERLGVGLPVMYLGDNVSKEGSGNDYANAQDLVVNVRSDEQMGVVIPYAKMGSGAREGEGILFELVSPPSRGFIDFSEAITRKEQRMAMTALAQFIFLGMGRVGTQALAGVSTDFFVEAVGAWADAVAEVINRFAIPRLMALNPFGLEELPQLVHSEIGVPKLNEIADYVNKLVGAQVILPYYELEKHLLELADLPEKPEGAVLERPQPQPKQEEPEAEEEMPEPPEEEDEEDEEGESGESVPEESAEPFALRLKRGGPKWERATNAYQQELQSTYAAWADNAARELAGIEDPEERATREEELIAAIIAALIVIGRRKLPEALALGLAGEESSPAGMGILAQPCHRRGRGELAGGVGDNERESGKLRGQFLVYFVARVWRPSNADA